MSQKLQAIRGMEDILPEVSPLWEKLEDACRDVFRQYGYRNIRTPLVEPTALFVRGLGEVTDIVEKEMYTFSSTSTTSRPWASRGRTWTPSRSCFSRACGRRSASVPSSCT